MTASVFRIASPILSQPQVEQLRKRNTLAAHPDYLVAVSCRNAGNRQRRKQSDKEQERLSFMCVYDLNYRTFTWNTLSVIPPLTSPMITRILCSPGGRLAFSTLIPSLVA